MMSKLKGIWQINVIVDYLKEIEAENVCQSKYDIRQYWQNNSIWNVKWYRSIKKKIKAINR